MNLKVIENITRESFIKYGVVIELTPDSKDGWEIVSKEANVGWRIAVMEFARKSTSILEKHPVSMESFEPVKGTALLIVAENSEPENFKVFLLDKPVCLNKGVWHQVISLSQVSCVKITENLEVDTVIHTLKNELSVRII
ncbi:MAG TPA: ureidoglycolate lyase [Ruminiclostridium sp.]|nr:ureidoglycolate lyase [Ruminiclostridium sp.]